MTIEKQPFRQYRDDEERKKDKRITFTISMNKKEYAELKENMQLIEQTKDSTALKQLAKIGAIVIHEPKIQAIIGSLFINKRRNKRLGIVDFD